jgi:hypothetical protein
MKINSGFRNTTNGTGFARKGMVDISFIHSHFESNNFPYFAVYPKFQKPV